MHLDLLYQGAVVQGAKCVVYMLLGDVLQNEVVGMASL